jgi:hypothetical protein
MSALWNSVIYRVLAVKGRKDPSSETPIDIAGRGRAQTQKHNIHLSPTPQPVQGVHTRPCITFSDAF